MVASSSRSSPPPASSTGTRSAPALERTTSSCMRFRALLPRQPGGASLSMGMTSCDAVFLIWQVLRAARAHAPRRAAAHHRAYDVPVRRGLQVRVRPARAEPATSWRQAAGWLSRRAAPRAPRRSLVSASRLFVTHPSRIPLQPLRPSTFLLWLAAGSVSGSTIPNMAGTASGSG